MRSSDKYLSLKIFDIWKDARNNEKAVLHEGRKVFAFVKLRVISHVKPQRVGELEGLLFASINFRK